MSIDLLNSNTANYLDAVVNPLRHTAPTKLPDGIDEPTIPMIDYYTSASLNIDVGNYAAAPANSIGCMVFISYSVTRNSYTNQGGNYPYRLLVLPVAENTLAPINYFGTGFIPSIQYANVASVVNLSKSIRLLAGGIRLTPKVEVVTNTATQYITKYYGGCLASADILKFQNGSNTILSLLESSKNFLEYSNAQGICVRLDHLQYEKQRSFYTPAELGDSDIVNFDKWYNSIIYLEFNTAIAPVLTGAAYSYTYPVKIYSKLFIEAQLAMPTPIISDDGYLDMQLESAIQAVRSTGDLFPCICQGHTFKSFLSKLKPFHAAISGALNAASVFIPDPRLRAVAKVSSAMAPIFGSDQTSQPSLNQLNKNEVVHERPVPLQRQPRKKNGNKNRNKKNKMKK